MGVLPLLTHCADTVEILLTNGGNYEQTELVLSLWHWSPMFTSFATALITTVLTVTPAQLPSVIEASKPVSREASALASPAALDLRGARPSLYRGKYYHADQERFRRCVAAREGSFTYMVRGGSNRHYHGTYQFNDTDWRRGLSYMMQAESKATGDGLAQEAAALRKVPIHKWNRYWQDRAFFTALNVRGKWMGRPHWNYAPKQC